MPIDDSFSGIEFPKLVNSMKRRYPQALISPQPAAGYVYIEIPVPGGSFPFRFTWQQFKYVALEKVNIENLRNGKFPEDWPK